MRSGRRAGRFSRARLVGAPPVSARDLRSGDALPRRRRPPPARDAAVARGRPRHAAAGAAAGGPGRRRQEARGAGAGRGHQLHRAAAGDGLERDACGACAVVPPHRARRASRRDAARAWRQRVDQDRSRSAPSSTRPVTGPFEARRRVVIIDEADALVEQAQHALLKTLEEPPSASIFLLVSSLPDALLPTVRSRCPRLRFGPLAPGEVAAGAGARSRLHRGRGARRGGRRRGQRRARAVVRVGRSRRCARDRHARAAARRAGRRSGDPPRHGAGSQPEEGLADERARPAGGVPADHGVGAARPRP